MIYVGLDYGSKRIGVACSDDSGFLADPVSVITYQAPDKVWVQLLPLIKELRAKVVVIGLPKRTTGEEGPEAKKVLQFAKELKERVDCDVVTWDERFTTMEAERIMREAEVSIKKRKEKRDSLAAKIMLQSYLDYKRLGNSSCTN